MKLTVDPDKNRIELKVQNTDTEQEDMVLFFPTNRVWYWYPFNINYYYKFSNAKEYLYLVKEKGYEGDNPYNVGLLKHTKELSERNGVMFHPLVYKRNRYIIDRARQLGLPTIKDIFTLSTVETGFSELGLLIHTVKNRIEDRLLDSKDEIIIPEMYSDNWDKQVYAFMTEEERRVLTEFGEMYAMLTVMRKIAEGR